MGLVISVDTSVAHLAGALGTPVCVLLHAIPTAKLYRQKSGQDWKVVLDKLRVDVGHSIRHTGEWDNLNITLRN
jgi:ADP-heptose:LPS heptosyltransferase